MYVASAAETPQAKAIRTAAMKFGNGETLPFTPCKKGYIPLVDGTRRVYACPLHNKEREKRVKRIGFRKGEFDLAVFWDSCKSEVAFENDMVLQKKESLTNECNSK